MFADTRQICVLVCDMCETHPTEQLKTKPQTCWLLIATTRTNSPLSLPLYANTGRKWLIEQLIQEKGSYFQIFSSSFCVAECALSADLRLLLRLRIKYPEIIAYTNYKLYKLYKDEI